MHKRVSIVEADRAGQERIMSNKPWNNLVVPVDKPAETFDGPSQWRVRDLMPLPLATAIGAGAVGILVGAGAFYLHARSENKVQGVEFCGDNHAVAPGEFGEQAAIRAARGIGVDPSPELTEEVMKTLDSQGHGTFQVCLTNENNVVVFDTGSGPSVNVTPQS